MVALGMAKAAVLACRSPRPARTLGARSGSRADRVRIKLAHACFSIRSVGRTTCAGPPCLRSSRLC